MARALGMKLLAAFWVWACIRFLPAPFGLYAGVLGALVVLAFLVQAVCRPGSQFFLPVVHRGPREHARIALTFDDGPDPEVTPRLLDLLRDHGAKATFFFVGHRAERFPEIVRRAHDEGHDVGTHTYTHSTRFHFGSRSFVFHEVERAIDAVRNILGKTPLFFRTPQGLRSPLATRVLRSYRGLTCFTWTRRAKDSLDTTEARIVERLFPHLQSGAILTLHDGRGLLGGDDREPTLAAVRRVLDECAARNLACTPLSTLLDRSAYGTLSYVGSEYGTALHRSRYPLRYRLPAPLYPLVRIVRALACGSAFVLFWVGAVVFAWVALPIAWLLGGSPEQRLRRNQRMLRQCFKVFHGYMRLFRLMDSRALEPLPARPIGSNRGRLLIANHTTLVDMTAIVASYPDVVCVAKPGYVENLWTGRLLRACGFVSAGRTSEEHQAMLDACERNLERGFDVLVFPEGTRSTPGSLHPFRRGAFEVACRSKADAILLQLRADPSALTKDLPFWSFPDTRVAHTIAVLQVVSPETFGYKSRTMCRAVELIFREKLGFSS
ncbi:MAG: polysaccharide deacetylase family protein [Polyangiaceae bacterium]